MSVLIFLICVGLALYLLPWILTALVIMFSVFTAMVIGLVMLVKAIFRRL